MIPKVSIIVPIYNVEKYIHQCVDSILKQTLRDIEVILVDDGSPDGCPRIVDQYAKKDARIKVIHRQNAGYGSAVNTGLGVARGKYVGIIEPDDWIEPTMMEELFDAAKESGSQVVKGMFWKTNSTLPKGQRDTVFANPSGVDLRLAPNSPFKISEWPQLLAFHASLWSAIYNREFLRTLEKGGVLFQETAGASYQDFPFIVKVLCAAKKIRVVKKPFVHWRNDPEQVHSTSATDKKAIQMIESCRTGIAIAKKSPNYATIKEALYIHVLWTNVGFFYNIDKKYRKAYWIALREILLPVKKDSSFKYSYFRKIDKAFFAVITNPHWSVVRLGFFAMKAYKNVKNLTR